MSEPRAKQAAGRRLVVSTVSWVPAGDNRFAPRPIAMLCVVETRHIPRRLLRARFGGVSRLAGQSRGAVRRGAMRRRGGPGRPPGFEATDLDRRATALGRPYSSHGGRDNPMTIAAGAGLGPWTAGLKR